MFTIEELATVPLFSALEDKALEYLAGEVEDIHLTAGEYVAHEGDGRALAVVVIDMQNDFAVPDRMFDGAGIDLGRRTFSW